MKEFVRKFDPLLIVVSLIFLFFRFFNLQNRIVFDWDQETLAYQMRNLILNHDIFLIGHRATDVKGFYFGPYFEYLQVPFFLLTKLHPIALMYSIMLINFTFLVLSYLIIKKLFNRQIAIGFILFWAVNPLVISYGITMWAPILIPIGILGTYYYLQKIFNDGSLKNWTILGLCLGFFTQIHSLFFAMDLFALIFLIHMLLTKTKARSKMVKKFLAFSGSFFIFTVPLLLFDLKHDFLNMRLLFEYFFHRSQGIPKLAESLQVFTNFLNPLIPFNNPYLSVLFYFGFLVLLFIQARGTIGFLKSFYISSLGVWVATAIVYLKFTQRPSEYYFLYLYPIIVLALLQFMQSKHKFGILALCIYVIIVNTHSIPSIVETYNRGLHEKIKTVEIVNSFVNNKNFNIAYDLPLGLATGYDYLFDFYNIPPTKDPKDPLVILRSPPRNGDIVISQLGISIPTSLTIK